MDDELVDAVLDVGARVRRIEQAPVVRLVVGEQQRRVGAPTYSQRSPSS